MGQEDMTNRDVRTQLGRNPKQGKCPSIWRVPARIAQICRFRREISGYFFVAVIADGDENLIVLPSTVPAHFWLPAVIEISLPRRRP